MNTLINLAGLMDSLYKGNWKRGQRHGYGVQLFVNGAKYIGNWKKNSAEGFGRLELIDGTFYEGNFSNNFIQTGKLQYFNGTYFEGDFDGHRDLFKSGKIVFRDNEVFVGMWSLDGIVLNGYLFTNDKKKLVLNEKNIIRDPSPNNCGKIVYWQKGTVYEGGLRKGNYDGKGFVYGNYRHPFYFECNILNNKFHGRYLYTSLYYGFSTEEHYSKGKEVGTWRYFTFRGYEYVGNTSTKKHFVRFPFINKDYYEGELNIWCQNITLVSGTYYMHNDQTKGFENTNQVKLIRVINCDSITTQSDILKRMFTYSMVCDLIEKARKDFRRGNYSSEDWTHYLESGITFKGHVINNYITCHINDLTRLFIGKRQGIPRNWELKSFGSLYSTKMDKSFDDLNINSLRLFKGTVVNGMKTGFCQVVANNNDEYRGFYQKNTKCGFGFYEVKDKFRFVGFFANGKMNGDGTMITSMNDMLKGNFVDGFLKGLGYIKYANNNLEFFGELLNNIKNGKGVLKFHNNYRFEGVFKDDVIDTTEQKGRLICKTDETVEEGFFMPSQDFSLGFLRTVEGKDYILDFKSGVVKKTI